MFINCKENKKIPGVYFPSNHCSTNISRPGFPESTYGMTDEKVRWVIKENRSL